MHFVVLRCTTSKHCKLDDSYIHTVYNFLYTVPTLRELVIELNEVFDWYELGISLNVPIWELKKIKQLNGGVERYKIELFDFWLRNAETTTWETIICAVRELNQNLAKRLAAKLNQQKPHLSIGVTKTEGIIKNKNMLRI